MPLPCPCGSSMTTSITRLTARPVAAGRRLLMLLATVTVDHHGLFDLQNMQFVKGGALINF